MAIHVLGFSGSLRQGSYNSALLRAAAEMLPPDMTLEIFDLQPIPLYDGDVEKAGVPEAVQHFRQRIAAADALLIACPEYNYSVTGVLKNAIDWASRPPDSPLNGKPLAMMGAGGGFGTVRAQNHLRQIVLHNDMMALNAPQLTVSRAFEHFDEEGRLTSERYRQQLADLLRALDTWTKRLQGASAA
jgi:chromate reductase